MYSQYTRESEEGEMCGQLPVPAPTSFSWSLSLHAPNPPSPQVYSTQCCLEEPHNQKALIKLLFSPQKRCSSEFKNCDKVTYNVTYSIVYHILTWVPLIVGQNHAGKQIHWKGQTLVLTHYSEGQMRISISKARGRNYNLAYLGSFFLVCTITTTPCLNEDSVEEPEAWKDKYFHLQ